MSQMFQVSQSITEITHKGFLKNDYIDRAGEPSRSLLPSNNVRFENSASIFEYVSLGTKLRVEKKNTTQTICGILNFQLLHC